MNGSREPGPKRVGESLDRLLDSMRAPTVDVLETVFHRWAEVVGPDLAHHTRPASIDGDRLVVKASDPTWASEFRWLEHEVLARLAEVSGTDRITALTVRVERTS